MSKSVNVDFVTRQIEVDTDGKEHFISAAMAAKDAEQSMLSAQNAADEAVVIKDRVEYLASGNFPYVTPQQFGAIGDGIADDTEAIQRAFNSGYNVIIPVGKYNISSALFISNSSINIVGVGGIIQATIPIRDCVINLVNCTNTTLANLTIMGNGLADDQASGYSYHAIKVINCRNIILEHNRIVNSSAGGIYLFDTQYAEITNNYFDGNKRLADISVGYAQSTNGLRNILVSNNTCISENNYGIMCQGWGETITITKNIVKNKKGYGICVYLMETSAEQVWDKVIINENHLENISYNADSGIYDGMGIYLQTVNNVVVSNNILKNILLNRPDVSDPNRTLNPSAIAISSCNKVACVNNIINGSVIDGIGITNSGTEQEAFIVSNNIVKNHNVLGIHIAASKNGIIANNYIKSDSNSENGILVEATSQGDVDNITMSANNIEGHKYSIYVTPKSDGANIKNITITGNSIMDSNNTFISVAQIDGLDISNNKLVAKNQTQLSGNYGILTQLCKNLIVNSNVLKADNNNTINRGIYLSECESGVVIGNSINNVAEQTYSLYKVNCTNIFGEMNFVSDWGLYPISGNYQIGKDFTDSTSRYIEYGTAAPTENVHAKGSICYNIEPTAGGNIGWVCVAGGTPGTWKPFGTIEA